jgi:predicted nucleic acid-binding protein
MDKYADQALSLVDATSFALMEHSGITRALSFDYHFRIYRKADGSNFEILP